MGVHPGVSDVRITWGEMNAEERTEVMLKARWNARQQAGDTQVPASTRVLAIASGKGGVGKSSVTVNLAVALAAQGRTVGVLDADIWGFSVPRLLGISERMEANRVEGSDRPLIRPNTMAVGDGLLKVVSTGFLVDEDTALMWRGLMLTKAVEQFLRDVDWGDLDDLLIDMPPGTGDVQMGLARLLPRADMVVVTTPALAAQKVAQRAADMARRSFVRVVGVIENMTDFTCDHGTSYPLFGAGGGAALAAEIGVPLLGQVPLEPAVSAGGTPDGRWPCGPTPTPGPPPWRSGPSPTASTSRSLAPPVPPDPTWPAARPACSTPSRPPSTPMWPMWPMSPSASRSAPPTDRSPEPRGNRPDPSAGGRFLQLLTETTTSWSSPSTVGGSGGVTPRGRRSRGRRGGRPRQVCPTRCGGSWAGCAVACRRRLRRRARRPTTRSRR